MAWTRNLILTTVALTALATVEQSAIAQSDADRTVSQYTCKDIMRENGDTRDVAISFLHGYLLGKSGGSSFNVATLEKQTDAFIDYCLDHPGEKAEDAMKGIKK